ncbi:hypothetical protein CLERM_191 [Coxiella-like endosymbiont]|nr:hypothetical protein CLERM_191 [Coxiella-like endosymbiont]
MGEFKKVISGVVHVFFFFCQRGFNKHKGTAYKALSVEDFSV